MEMKEELLQVLTDTVNRGLYHIIISNAREKDKAFKIKIRPVMLQGEILFQETVYQGVKVFHTNYKDIEMIPRIEQYLFQDFKQCEIEHTNSKVIILVSKKGKMTIKKKLHAGQDKPVMNQNTVMCHNRTKNYILKEGIPVPFLIDLGVQTTDGRIIRSRYDKYRQINRFLEFIEDILPAFDKDRELRIIDFGCGKSYLTFAMYYYLHELMKRDVAITGLDLKEDVIAHCNELCHKYGYQKLEFIKGDIAEYEKGTGADMVVTLHACDTATDYALKKAVTWGAKVILSVPCCQHEVNREIACEKLQPILQYGIVKERMSALITDALRADLLKTEGYETDLLEFIDMEHTPKNILIRAVKREEKSAEKKAEELNKIADVTEFLQIKTTLQKLLEGN